MFQYFVSLNSLVHVVLGVFDLQRYIHQEERRGKKRGMSPPGYKINKKEKGSKRECPHLGTNKNSNKQHAIFVPGWGHSPFLPSSFLLMDKIQQIHDFVRIFKFDDPQPHYEVITELLAKKSGKIEDDDGLLLKPKTNSRQIFKNFFCLLMQICHSHYFSWWMAMISSAADQHGKANSNITSFFRIMML